MSPSAAEESLNVLVLDDEKVSRTAMEQCLADTPCRVTSVGDAEEAMRLLEGELFDVAFFDLRLDGASGIELIPGALERAPWVKIVLMTAHASIESAVDAIRAGAVDYLEKPFSPTKVKILTEKLLAVRRKERKVNAMVEEAERSASPRRMESEDAEMRKVLELARRAADSSATILLLGESGTGKGVVARAMHRWSGRSNGPFSVVNCPSLSEELLRSELFGHERGAFTGAVKTNRGRIETTQGGTLFLDEIGDLPLSIQPQLLRFMQDREYERVGGTTTRTSDVRIMTATNRDIERAVREGEFREDLYYRLKVIEIRIPPLRERQSDILPLAEMFLHLYSARNGRQIEGFSKAAKKRVQAYPWPGNIRELQNAVERAVILAAGREIGPELFPSSVPGTQLAGMKDTERGLLSLEEVEKAHIKYVLDSMDTVQEAADTLGISTPTLWRRRKKYDL